MQRRAQSAMEYLMTYGWSILVIAIVIAVLFALGVFSGSNGGRVSACVAVSGFQCTSPVLYSSGYLSATIGEFGQGITIISTACSTSSTAAPPMPGASLSQTIASGQSASLNFACPSTSLSTLGSTFSGTLWIEYNIPNGQQGVIQKVASVKAVVSSLSTTPSGSGAIAYVPLTVTNTNTITATSSPLQEMVSFNPASYSGYTAADLGNIRFYEGGTELNSWCESGCTYSSSNSVFWVSIPGGIGFNAGGTANVLLNMTFLPTNTEYDGVYSGEAPQLTSTYAKYDNGVNVFTYYTNFYGVTLPTNWQSGITISGNPYGTSVSVSNGVSIGTTSSDSNIEYNQVLNMQTTAADAYGGVKAGNSSSLCQGCWGVLNGSTSVPVYNHGGILWSSSGTYYYSPNGGASWTNTGATVGYSVLSWAQNATYNLNGYNYNQYSSSLGSNSQPKLPQGFFVVLGGGSGYSPDYFQWFRTRSLPPNGAMPRTSFGSLSH